jgi:transcriptional regulator with XRE-family HTH domain
MLKLTVRRKQLNISQSSLADQLGIRRESVCRLETGRFSTARLPWGRVRKLEALLGSSAEELLSEVQSEPT